MAYSEARVHNHTAIVKVSFESKVCLEMDPTLVKIDVCLRFKNVTLRMDRGGQVCSEYIVHRTIGNSNVCFDFGDESIGLSTAANLSDEFHNWLPELIPSDCDRVSQDIVQSARLVAISHHGNGGAIVVSACIEADKETHDRSPFNLQDLPWYTVSPSDIPRGLSLREINELKQETFKGAGNDECSICFENFLLGVKITKLRCHHSFHHGCIASWLEKQASCPFCRLDLIKSRKGINMLLVLDDTVIYRTLSTRIVITPLPQDFPNTPLQLRQRKRKRKRKAVS